MSQVDWSEAPEGATHYMPGSQAWSKGFWKIENGVSFFSERKGIDWRSSFANPWDSVELVSIVKSAWNGEGLPPVGTVCEWHNQNHDDAEGWAWCESQVVGYSPCGLFVFMQKEGCWPTVNKVEQCEFRPIRTPEQIAAEERERAVDEMVTVWKRTMGRFAQEERGLAEMLYDAGYRKVTP